MLLAKRQNEPAKGEWFWPGSCLRKGGRLHDASHRVASDELGVEINLKGFLGVYEHFWEDVEPTQHTVNIVYNASPTDAEAVVRLDDQHSEYRWVNEPSETFHPYVNEYLEDLGHQGDA